LEKIEQKSVNHNQKAEDGWNHNRDLRFNTYGEAELTKARKIH
jgi:hypothetical protein